MQNFKDLDCKWGQPYLMNIPQRECKSSSQDVREYGFREKGVGFFGNMAPPPRTLLFLCLSINSAPPNILYLLFG